MLKGRQCGPSGDDYWISAVRSSGLGRHCQNFLPPNNGFNILRSHPAFLQDLCNSFLNRDLPSPIFDTLYNDRWQVLPVLPHPKIEENFAPRGCMLDEKRESGAVQIIEAFIWRRHEYGEWNSLDARSTVYYMDIDNGARVGNV